MGGEASARIWRIRQKSCGGRGAARRAAQTWNPVLCLRGMKAKHVTPILNVSDMAASFAWFAKWGWGKLWDWGTPPTFGAGGSGWVEIFLCPGGEGEGVKGRHTTTFRRAGDAARE